MPAGREAPRGYVADTNVVSNRGDVEGDPNLVAWLRRYAGLVRISVVTVAEKWAEISVRFPSLRDADKAIAATALAKGFGVATENTGDFRRTRVALVNPFDSDSWDADQGDDPIASLLRPGPP